MAMEHQAPKRPERSSSRCHRTLVGGAPAAADLAAADLRGSSLRLADLTARPSLCGGPVRGRPVGCGALVLADLRDADLHGADLSGADLFGALLHDADLSGACSPARTWTGPSWTGPGPPGCVMTPPPVGRRKFSRVLAPALGEHGPPRWNPCGAALSSARGERGRGRRAFFQMPHAGRRFRRLRPITVLHCRFLGRPRARNFEPYRD